MRIVAGAVCDGITEGQMVTVQLALTNRIAFKVTVGFDHAVEFPCERQAKSFVQSLGYSWPKRFVAASHVDERTFENAMALMRKQSGPVASEPVLNHKFDPEYWGPQRNWVAHFRESRQLKIDADERSKRSENRMIRKLTQ